MIIITGATGFIGMYTVERLLKAGKEVVATGRNEIIGEYLRKLGAQFIALDITKEKDFDKLPIDHVEGIIHLAGLLPANVTADLDSNENAADYFEVNVLGTIHLLEYCRKNGIRKVIGSTSYSDVAKAWKKGYAISEDEPRNFHFKGDHAVYVISKNAANDIMEYYNQQHGLQCAWFRFPPVYGVGPHASIYVNGKLRKSGIQTFIENAAQGKDIELWGDPHITRDIIYVKDVAEAFLLALMSEKTYGLYNMTSGTELDLEEQARTVIQVFGIPNKPNRLIYCPDKPNSTPSYLFDMSKAYRDFGFKPKYTSYFAMMQDYKQELESGKWNVLLQTRNKNG